MNPNKETVLWYFKEQLKGLNVIISRQNFYSWLAREPSVFLENVQDIVLNEYILELDDNLVAMCNLRGRCCGSMGKHNYVLHARNGSFPPYECLCSYIGPDDIRNIENIKYIEDNCIKYTQPHHCRLIYYALSVGNVGLLHILTKRSETQANISPTYDLTLLSTDMLAYVLENVGPNRVFTARKKNTTMEFHILAAKFNLYKVNDFPLDIETEYERCKVLTYYGYNCISEKCRLSLDKMRILEEIDSRIKSDYTSAIFSNEIIDKDLFIYLSMNYNVELTQYYIKNIDSMDVSTVWDYLFDLDPNIIYNGKTIFQKIIKKCVYRPEGYDNNGIFKLSRRTKNINRVLYMIEDSLVILLGYMSANYKYYISCVPLDVVNMILNHL